MLQVSNVPKGGAMSNEDGEVMVDPEAANTNIHEKEGGYGKKRFSRPVVAAAICLLVLLIVGILLVVLDFTVGLTKSNDKSYQNDETHGNQGSEEHDEYYSSKCPEEFAMIYPEWHSNQCRLPHRHHPWFNIIRDELIDDQSVSRTYPP